MTLIVGGLNGGTNEFGADDLTALTSAALGTHTSTQFSMSVDGFTVSGTGTGFLYSGNHPSAGTINSIAVNFNGSATFSGLNVSAASLWQAASTGDVNTFNTLLFGGDDTLVASTSQPFTSLAGYAGNDTFDMGPMFSSSTLLDGGDGNDVLKLNGNYFDPLEALQISQLTSVEKIVMAAGHSYSLWFHDSSDPGVSQITIDASALGVGDVLSLRTEGTHSFAVTGGAGDDVLFGGSSGNDTFNGGAGTDTIEFFSTSTALTINLGLTTAQNIGSGFGSDTFVSVENIVGGGGNDTLTGNASDNVLEGGGGNNTLNGGGGTDTASYQDMGAISVDLSSGNTIFHGDGTDTLISIENIVGSSSNDSFIGNASDNSFDGGGDINNSALYTNATGGVTFDMTGAAVTVTGDGVGHDTLKNVQSFTGSSFNDTVFAGDTAFAFDGYQGEDTVDFSHLTHAVTWPDNNFPSTYSLQTVFKIVGTNFNDTLDSGFAVGNFGEADGGGGDDHLHADRDHQTLIGGSGDDVLAFSDFTADNIADGGTGSDTANLYIDSQVGQILLTPTNFLNVEHIVIDGFFMIDIKTDDATCAAGQTIDVTYVNSQNTGTDQTVTFDASAEKDGSYNIQTGNSNDTLIGGAGNDTLNGGAGLDAVSYAAASSGVTVDLNLATAQNIGGGQGNDTLISIETVTGSSFDDLIVTNAADNFINGGDGIDSVSYAHATGGVTVDLMTFGSQNVGGGMGTDTLFFVENLIGSDFNDALTGDAGSNVLSGGKGNDQLDGGGGIDTASYTGASGGVTVSLAVGGSQVIGADQGSDTLANIENLVGSIFADTLKAGATDSVLIGLDGNDTLIGGAGNDTLDGGSGLDSVSYAGASGGVTVDLGVATSQNVGGGQGSDTLISIENVTGSSFGDLLAGNSADNVINGGDGNDTVSYAHAGGGVTVSLASSGAQSVGGGMGTDTVLFVENLIGSDFNDALTGDAGSNVLSGGKGNDQLDGGGGIDTASYTGASGSVTVSLAVGGLQVIGADQGSDTLANIENLVGSNFADTLRGSTGGNVLSGLDGNDTLDISLGGSDTVSGGSGDDTMLAGARLTVADRIDGGAGYDSVALNGDYSAGLTLSGVMLSSIEHISVAGASSYNLTIDDAMVAAGQTLTIDESVLGPGQLTLNLSAESDGNLNVTCGLGDDVVFLGRGVEGIVAGSGVDTINAGGNLTAADRLDGGRGLDTLVLNGNYKTGLTFSATTMVNVEQINFGAGFSYKLATDDGNVATGQSLSINGAALGAADTLTFDGSAETDGKFAMTGGAGNDVLTGGAQADSFDLSLGGRDSVSGGGGDDAISFGAAYTGADHVDGGAGNDTLALKGDYSGGLTLAIAGIETLSLGGGFSYALTAPDTTLTAGQVLTVDGTHLGSQDKLTFRGNGETDGSFAVASGSANDNLFGGAGNDAISSGGGSDVIDLTTGGNDTANGGAGDDTIRMGASLTAGDHIDGGTGVHDILDLNGDYSGLVFVSDTMVNIDRIKLHAAHSYNLTSNDANLAAGATMAVDALDLGATDHLVFDGSAETNGSFLFLGGSGDDTLTGGSGIDRFTGGKGADHLTGGSGADTFIYKAAGDSTGPAYDTVTGFDFASDRFDLFKGVKAIDVAVTTGSLSTASFDTDLAAVLDSAHLGKQHAVLFTASAGTLAGQTFLVVDTNGVAGYQAGLDLAIHLDSALNAGAIGHANFI